MDRWVEIQFDCLPLRSLPRWDAPLDASPKYEALCQRLKTAAQKHGTHNAYYLLNARCTFHLTNHPSNGMVSYRFEGVALTDAHDRHTVASDLDIRLDAETCPWLTEPVAKWFEQSVTHAVEVEFDRYIDAGDLQRTEQRMQQIEAASDAADGFLGMFL